jgi:hypothetical protein
MTRNLIPPRLEAIWVEAIWAKHWAQKPERFEGGNVFPKTIMKLTTLFRGPPAREGRGILGRIRPSVKSAATLF